VLDALPSYESDHAVFFWCPKVIKNTLKVVMKCNIEKNDGKKRTGRCRNYNSFMVREKVKISVSSGAKMGLGMWLGLGIGLRDG